MLSIGSFIYVKNPTNPVNNIYACIYQQCMAIIYDIEVIFIPLKTKEFHFLIGDCMKSRKLQWADPRQSVNDYVRMAVDFRQWS